jgi:hypothetical protein
MDARFVVDIEATVDTVFYWAVQPEAVLQWLEHLTEYEFTNEGDEWVGTTVRQVWDNDKDSELLGTITEFEEHKRFAIALEGPKFSVTVAYTFEDLGEKTRLTQETEFKYKGMTKVLEKTMASKVKNSYDNQNKSNLLRLMDLCENDTDEEH